MEKWRAIQAFPNYEVSDCGNVRSIDRDVIRKGNKTRLKGQMLKPSNHNGYLMVTLYNGSRDRHKSLFVHRLVADAFINNPLCLPYINHKDEDKMNNVVDNLEWCDAKYNSNYGTAIQRRIIHQDWKSIADKQSKQVIQRDFSGNIIKTYPSTMEAQRLDGYNPASISKCCNGLLKTYKGYKWEYAN